VGIFSAEENTKGGGFLYLLAVGQALRQVSDVVLQADSF
jgi:hypothetical protein